MGLTNFSIDFLLSKPFPDKQRKSPSPPCAASLPPFSLPSSSSDMGCFLNMPITSAPCCTPVTSHNMLSLTNLLANSSMPCSLYPQTQRVPPSRTFFQAAAVAARRCVVSTTQLGCNPNTVGWNSNQLTKPTAIGGACSDCVFSQTGDLPTKTSTCMQYFYQQTSTLLPSSSSSSNGWSRAVFSNLQRKGLERSFRVQSYISRRERQKLAATLGLSENQVRIWFANRRMKDKKVVRRKADKKKPLTK